MAKYHIDAHGNPAPCTAKTRACPRGGEEVHGSSPQEVAQKFEAQQAASTLPATAQKPKAAGVDPKLLKKIASQDGELKKLAEEQKSIMKKVEPELNRVKVDREAVRATRALAVEQVLKQTTLDDLADPESADTIYRLAWDDGRGPGMTDLNHFTHRTHLSIGSWSVDRSDPSLTPTPILLVHSPDDLQDAADEEKLERTAAVIEKTYPVQLGLNPDARIDVLSPDDYFTKQLTLNEGSGEWQLENRQVTTFKDKELRKVLKRAFEEAHEERISRDYGDYSANY